MDFIVYNVVYRRWSDASGSTTPGTHHVTINSIFPDTLREYTVLVKGFQSIYIYIYISLFCSLPSDVERFLIDSFFPPSRSKFCLYYLLLSKLCKVRCFCVNVSAMFLNMKKNHICIKMFGRICVYIRILN